MENIKDRVNAMLEAAEIEAVSFFDKAVVTAAKLENGEVILAAHVCEGDEAFDSDNGAELCLIQMIEKLSAELAADGAKPAMTAEQAQLIIALSENNLSGTETAKKLGWGRTKLYRVLKDIREQTGKDPLEFFGMCELLVMARDVLKEA